MRITDSSELGKAIRDEAGKIAGVEVATAADELLDCAVARSSGPYKLDQLAKKDYPYAKRHKKPGLDPGTINEQSGTFRSDWRVKKVDGMHQQVVNTDPIGEYLVTEDGEGTDKMVHRGVDEAAQSDLVKKRPRLEHVKSLPSI